MSLKTTKTNESVEAFLQSISDEQKRLDCNELLTLFRNATSHEPALWGTSIIGFGNYSYTRSDGTTHEFFPVGFSPRSNAISIYAVIGSDTLSQEDLQALGSYKTGKGCIYIKRLADIDMQVLQKIIKQSHDKASGKHLNYKTGQWESKS